MEAEPLEEQDDPLDQNIRSTQMLMLRDCVADLVAILKEQNQRISTLENKLRTLERVKP